LAINELDDAGADMDAIAGLACEENAGYRLKFPVAGNKREISAD